MPVMPNFDPSALLDIADKLGLIDTVKKKLIRNPDAAADKLATVLDELSKIYSTLESELVRYLCLYFDPAGNLAAERQVLLTLESGQLTVRMGDARGHCHKIWNIYQNHLDRWFHRVLSAQEAADMQRLFEALSYGDSQMELAIHQLASWLGTAASETLDLVDEGKLDEAQRCVRTARREVLPARQAITQTLVSLVALQADFVAASGTD
jgi:hypothetical protein